MKITCEALRKWLEKMPNDAEVRFFIAEDQIVAERELQVKECAPQGSRIFKIELLEF